MDPSRHSKSRSLRNWLPAMLGCLMIVCESTATMSASNTSRWLYPVWVRLFGPISGPAWEQVHHLIRKAGHFIGYGVVSLTFFYGWWKTLGGQGGSRLAVLRSAAARSVLCTLLVASLDEFHQSFLPSRTASPIDVCIDTFGAITAQLLLLLIVRPVFLRFRPASA